MTRFKIGDRVENPRWPNSKGTVTSPAREKGQKVYVRWDRRFKGHLILSHDEDELRLMDIVTQIGEVKL